MLRLAVASLAVASLSWAQNISSGLSGTIVDQTDAIIPGAQVTARQSRTGFSKGIDFERGGILLVPGPIVWPTYDLDQARRL